MKEVSLESSFITILDQKSPNKFFLSILITTEILEELVFQLTRN